MSLDPRTPVVVGVGAVTQHVDDPREGAEALELMAMALERAADDADRPSLLSAVDTLWMPRGFWAYSNPGRLLAERFGAPKVRTGIAEIGVLQTSLLGRAVRDLVEGRSEVTFLVGGESRDRDVRLARGAQTAPTIVQKDSRPTEVLRPDAEIVSRLEIELGLVRPAVQYAMIDNALRFREDQSIAAHRAELGALWSDFNRAAVANPMAWDRSPLSADAITTPGGANRMLAFPYTKSLVSQWNVNQAGALILCTLEKARALGLEERRFIYPLAVVDAEHMLPLTERRAMHRSAGFRLAFDSALSHVGLGVHEITHLELYSCFPAAVRVQQRELDLDRRRRVTLTGGMTFAGGPLNNFVIQGWVRMVEQLRSDPGSTGLVTAVSGLMTKQGVSILGAEPLRPFLFDSVTQAAKSEQETIAVDPAAEGQAQVTSYTVIHDRDAMPRVALVCDFDEQRRALRVLEDREIAEEGETTELSGREVELGRGGAIRWR